MKEKRSKGAFLAAVIEFTKIRITVSVTLSTLAGYILYSGRIDEVAAWASLGVFLLASASAALNQYQERRTDALMARTARRPIPSGRIRKGEAFVAIAVLFMAGSAVLYFKTRHLSLALGLLSFFWYNAIYTPLKYRTVFAVIIGSLIGAIPPVIGWVAAGGEVFSRPALFLAFFIYLWQVPHFIFLLLIHGDDYKEAGLPVLTTYYSGRRINRIIMVWIMGTIISGFMLPFMCVTNYALTTILIISVSAALILIVPGIPGMGVFKVKRSFIMINLYLLIILLGIIADRML